MLLVGITVTADFELLGSRKFIRTACNVPEPEDRFNIDEYSEMVSTMKPVIYITVGELIDTHKVSWLRRVFY